MIILNKSRKLFGVINLAMLLLIIIGCGNPEKSVAGLYIKSPSINTIDSLLITLEPMGVALGNDLESWKYIQKFYDRKTGNMLFQNSNFWWIDKDGGVVFVGFYWDADGDHQHFKYSEEAMKDKVILFRTRKTGDKIFIGERTAYVKSDSF